MSPDPIQLAIYSPNVPNLTMVDMPGALPAAPCITRHSGARHLTTPITCAAGSISQRETAEPHSAAGGPAVAAVEAAPLLAAGLTKVPIDGQPKSIVQDLENMARTYIKVPPMTSARRLHD